MLTRVPVPPAIAEGAPSPGRKVAVLICHGMGQQVPFETLALVVAALDTANGQPASGLEGTRVDQRGVRMASHRDQPVPLVHVGVTPPGGAARHLTLFECYWAPVTAGRVHLANAILFYLRAGVRGLRYSLGRRFGRRIGERYWAFPLGWSVQIALALALDVLLAVTGWLVALELLCVLVLWRVLALPGGRLLPFGGVGYAVVVFLLAALMGGLVAWAMSGLLARPTARTETPVPADEPGPPLNFAVRLARRVAAWLLVGVPFAALLWGVLCLLDRLGVRGWIAEAPEQHVTLALVGLALLTGLLVTGRAFLIEYTGDVAAYMSAHEVSRFADIRAEIQARCRTLVEYVYGLYDGGPWFDEVVVVGHSLGSVVAYDVLNDVLARDRAAAEELRCAERTALFLTFGSPLDKIAFIFRSQKPDQRLDVREELAAARQPMLLDDRYRPRRWVNLSNPFDWIGADIDYFDLQPRTPDRPERIVHNLVERHVTDPGNAHGRYWQRRAFQQLMLWGAAGCPSPMPGDAAFEPARTGEPAIR